MAVSKLLQKPQNLLLLPQLPKLKFRIRRAEQNAKQRNSLERSCQRMSSRQTEQKTCFPHNFLRESIYDFWNLNPFFPSFKRKKQAFEQQ